MSTATTAPPPSLDGDDAYDRPFSAGTTGWTADDLDDPRFESLWEAGKYEIVEGVLTQLPAARLDDGRALFKLMSRVQAHLDATGDQGAISFETDVIVEKMRVPRVDAVYLAADLLPAQEAANAKTRRPRGRYGRVLVVPTLIVENISPGHEAHDRVTKRRWYAERGVPHYWLLDAYGKTLETLVLNAGAYQTDQLGREDDEVRPTLFPRLVIPLAKVWA
jgi:Uma2 family endonuclease